MKYIEKVLQPGEKIVFSCTLSWAVYIPSIALWLAALLLLAAGSALRPSGPWLWASLVMALLAAGSSLKAWFRRWTTEIDVTDRRIVYKRGFIRRHTVEMNMDKVESVDVDQSILGRVFDYGDIVVRGTGVGIEPLRGIDSPLAFRNAVTAR
jgi:Bacterial PH domain